MEASCTIKPHAIINTHLKSQTLSIHIQNTTRTNLDILIMIYSIFQVLYLSNMSLLPSLYVMGMYQKQVYLSYGLFLNSFYTQVAVDDSGGGVLWLCFCVFGIYKTMVALFKM